MRGRNKVEMLVYAALLTLALRLEAGRGERALAQVAFERIGSSLRTHLRSVA